jgi:type IV secretory pathway VirB6-like protein
MKIEIKLLKENQVDNETYLLFWFILSIIVIMAFGFIIGTLLDNELITILLPIIPFFVLLFLTQHLSRLRIRRLK